MMSCPFPWRRYVRDVPLLCCARGRRKNTSVCCFFRYVYNIHLPFWLLFLPFCVILVSWLGGRVGRCWSLSSWGCSSCSSFLSLLVSVVRCRLVGRRLLPVACFPLPVAVRCCPSVVFRPVRSWFRRLLVPLVVSCLRSSRSARLAVCGSISFSVPVLPWRLSCGLCVALRVVGCLCCVGRWLGLSRLVSSCLPARRPALSCLVVSSCASSPSAPVACPLVGLFLCPWRARRWLVVVPALSCCPGARRCSRAGFFFSVGSRSLPPVRSLDPTRKKKIGKIRRRRRRLHFFSVGGSLRSPPTRKKNKKKRYLIYFKYLRNSVNL